MMEACIETPRLFIRAFRADDGRDLYAYLSQEEVVRFEPYGVFSPEQARVEAIRRAGDPRFLAVCLKGSGRLIGNLYLEEKEMDTWELGYVFHRDFQGKGYATEAARAAVGDVFANGAYRVFAMCNPENAASWRLMERLGMRREAHFRRNTWFSQDDAGNPVWQDTYVYAILREEWRGFTE